MTFLKPTSEKSSGANSGRQLDNAWEHGNNLATPGIMNLLCRIGIVVGMRKKRGIQADLVSDDA
jgi:hypothetical protein